MTWIGSDRRNPHPYRRHKPRQRSPHRRDRPRGMTSLGYGEITPQPRVAQRRRIVPATRQPVRSAAAPARRFCQRASLLQIDHGSYRLLFRRSPCAGGRFPRAFPPVIQRRGWKAAQRTKTRRARAQLPARSQHAADDHETGPRAFDPDIRQVSECGWPMRPSFQSTV